MFASNRPGGRIVLLMGLVLAFASLSTAQDNDWEGPAALAIEVRGDDGKPVEGATILLRVADRTPPVGPPAVTTDDHGRAVISHLGELEWYVEVSHESFMVYAAYIKVKADKKPVTGFSSQVNTATSWTPMRIKFAKAKADFTRKLTKKERRAERQIADLEHRAPEARQPVSPPPAATPPVVAGQTPQSPPPASQPSTATTIEARQPAPAEETPAEPSGTTVAATVTADEESQPEEETETVMPAATAIADAPSDEVAEPSATAVDAAAEPAAMDAAAQDAAEEQRAAAEAAALEAAERAASQAQASERERAERAAAEKAAAEAAVEAAAEQAAADAAAEQAAERAAAEARAAEQAVAREAAAKAAAEQAAADKTAAEAAAQDAAEEQRAAAEAAELEAAERAASQARAAAEASAERIAAEEAATRAAEEAAAAERLAATEAAELEAAEQAAAEAEAAARTIDERIATEEAAQRAAEQQAATEAAQLEAAEPPATEATPSPPAEPSVAEATASAPKAPAAAPAVPRPIPSYMASADLGTCAGCQPGEWSMIDQETVANARSNRTDTCPADPDAVLAGIRQLVESVEPSFTGTISAALIPSRYAPVEREARAEIRQQLGAYLQATSTCRLVGVLLPADSKFSGYQYEAWSAAGGGACIAGLDCAVGRARWNDEPVFVEGPVTAIFALFHNRSERYDRRARFTVYFVPPSPDWTP